MREFINIIKENSVINSERHMNEEIEVDTAEAPEYWASYLVNGDDSSLDEEEIRLADKWLESIAPYRVVSVQGEPHFTHSYNRFDPRYKSGSVVEYVLHK